MIHLENISVDLGGRTVVNDVSARLAADTVHVLVGPNGAGKSTLLRALTALLPLKAGKVALNAEDISRMSPARRADHIAYLPQDRSIAWDLAAVDVAALGAWHLAPELARQKAFAELETLGLKAEAERGVFGLSGGQRARVLLARLLLSPASVYVLDEPLVALDPAWQRQVLAILKQKAVEGATVVLSLHDLQLAAQFADNILLMHEGRLVRSGAPENIFMPKDLRTVFNLAGELVNVGGQRLLTLNLP